MVQVPSHVVCFFPLLSDHQETFSLWSGFIIASGFDGAYGQMSPAFCVCVTDEQQCCEPHGSQQHLTGSERIRKTHQLHPRAAEHDVSRSDFYPSTRFTLTVHPGAEELLILQPLNITTELACSAQYKHISWLPLFKHAYTHYASFHALFLMYILLSLVIVMIESSNATSYFGYAGMSDVRNPHTVHQTSVSRMRPTFCTIEKPISLRHYVHHYCNKEYAYKAQIQWREYE